MTTPDIEGHADDPVRLAAVEALARDMHDGGRGRDDPIRAVFALIGDRWTMLILTTLGIGSWRHAELRRTVGALAIEEGISQRVLTEKLRALERLGFVSRDTTDDVPPRVTYSLTAMGRGLLDQTGGLMGWIKSNREAIDAARTRFAAMRD